MIFAKLNEKNIVLFKNPLRIEGEDIFTNDKDLLLQHGWKEIIFTNSEEKEDFYPVVHWEETETQIVQKWEYEPIESEEE